MRANLFATVFLWLLINYNQGKSTELHSMDTIEMRSKRGGVLCKRS